MKENLKTQIKNKPNNDSRSSNECSFYVWRIVHRNKNIFNTSNISIFSCFDNDNVVRGIENHKSGSRLKRRSTPPQAKQLSFSSGSTEETWRSPSKSSATGGGSAGDAVAPRVVEEVVQQLVAQLVPVCLSKL